MSDSKLSTFSAPAISNYLNCPNLSNLFKLSQLLWIFRLSNFPPLQFSIVWTYNFSTFPSSWISPTFPAISTFPSFSACYLCQNCSTFQYRTFIFADFQLFQTFNFSQLFHFFTTELKMTSFANFFNLKLQCLQFVQFEFSVDWKLNLKIHFAMVMLKVFKSICDRDVLLSKYYQRLNDIAIGTQVVIEEHCNLNIWSLVLSLATNLVKYIASLQLVLRI